MWDAWAAFDPTAAGYTYHEKFVVADVPRARAEAISYAAFRILTARFANAVGGEESLQEFKALMRSLCYPFRQTSREGNLPSAIGNRIAARILRRGLGDGSNEALAYRDAAYVPVNDPLILADGGSFMADPNRWQPLQMAVAVSQNGVGTTNLQTAIGTHWGRVDGFGVLDPDGDAVAIDPGPPPLLGDPASDAALKEQLIEIVRDSALLDPRPGTAINISPGALGANLLGTNDGAGHPLNPATGQPYPPQVVNLADYMRAATQFWADGPASETPPGHWNVIANAVGDELGAELRIGGIGPVVDRLQWDVKAYPGPERRRPQRRHRGMGPEGSLRQQPPDLAHPPHGRPRSVQRPVACVISPIGAAAGARADRADHPRLVGGGQAPLPAPCARRRDRRACLGGLSG
jgi:hypothetical protein